MPKKQKRKNRKSHRNRNHAGRPQTPEQREAAQRIVSEISDVLKAKIAQEKDLMQSNGSYEPAEASEPTEPVIQRTVPVTPIVNTDRIPQVVVGAEKPLGRGDLRVNYHDENGDEKSFVLDLSGALLDLNPILQRHKDTTTRLFYQDSRAHLEATGLFPPGLTLSQVMVIFEHITEYASEYNGVGGASVDSQLMRFYHIDPQGWSNEKKLDMYFCMKAIEAQEKIQSLEVMGWEDVSIETIQSLYHAAYGDEIFAAHMAAEIAQGQMRAVARAEEAIKSAKQSSATAKAQGEAVTKEFAEKHPGNV